MMEIITKSNIFGTVRCHMYSIEWQKAGLSHAHILLWLTNRIQTNEIDSVISAELPDQNLNKNLFEIVKSHMMHSPCGTVNFDSPCMKGIKCSKRFSKAFLKVTETGADGYPSYSRRKPEGLYYSNSWP
ncbi:hypothetical protein AVEN_215500-1 [Araneus ventricosus]|uniref:Helitron helicase-like domain-containing protein n=1 Tax=Araneus ventricosus TaxID=182803 RepID=A0A4Y2BFK2_ARAVE|nr:hypothetical protein AVEN_215500-1 [Araneus ventricosus]